MIRSSIVGEFLQGEEGASIVEYALVLVFITILTLGGMAALGIQISAFFASVSTSL